MTVPALLARIRSAADAEMGLMLTPDDVILLDAEVFRLTQAVEDLRRVCDFTRGQVEYLRAHRELCTENLLKGYETGKAEERTAVVAWLRAWQDQMDDRITHDDADYAIRVIERGEHRREEEP